MIVTRIPPSKDPAMVLSLITLITVIAAYLAFAAAALRWGVDSRRDDGRPNW